MENPSHFQRGYMKTPLTFNATGLGLQECCLDLSMVYQNKDEMKKFDARWERFFAVDREYQSVFARKNNLLIYKSETLIPTKTDDRPPVLLVFGNPASQSVFSEMCFAFEGDNHEHRIWSAFRKSGWLKFYSDNDPTASPWQLRNKKRKEDFFNLDYDSPFRLGITVYLSLPSPASELMWAGVSGVRKLFGQKVLRVIEIHEQVRLHALIRDFVGDQKGGVVAFQRDAYEALRSFDSPQYSLKSSQSAELSGVCKKECGSNMFLAGSPPTRYAHTHGFCRVLETIGENLLSQNNTPISE